MEAARAKLQPAVSRLAAKFLYKVLNRQKN